MGGTVVFRLSMPPSQGSSIRWSPRNDDATLLEVVQNLGGNAKETDNAVPVKLVVAAKL